MNHPELVERMAAGLGLARAEADTVVRVIARAIARNALSQARVELRGFGTFSAVKTSARPARNFKTGQTITAAPHLKLKFKPSPTLRAELNQSALGARLAPPKTPCRN